MNIEALKEAHDLSLDGRDFAARQIILDVIADLEKKEPAQPELKPFGWLYSLIVESQVVNQKFSNVNWDTKHEPFGRHGVDHGGKVTKMPLYNTPPQRKPLTDEQIDGIASKFYPKSYGLDEFARAIEAAHGIKE